MEGPLSTECRWCHRKKEKRKGFLLCPTCDYPRNSKRKESK